MADGHRTDDELKQARERRQFEQRCREVDEDLATPNEEVQQQRSLRVILESGSFSEDDLQRMLRGQLITYYGSACRERIPILEDDSEDEDRNPEYPCPTEKQRIFDQRARGRPLDPVPHPRNRLMCPLEERALNGDETVPCYCALNSRSAPDGRYMPAELRPGDSSDLLYIKKAEVVPCQVFHEVALDFLMPMIEGSWRPDAKEAETPRARLKHLLETGRVTEGELDSMVGCSAVVTDEGWLPCRDDPQRTNWFPPERGDELYNYAWPYAERAHHMLCPLHARGLLGDRTVPCCEAQDVEPYPKMIEEVERWRKSTQQDETGPAKKTHLHVIQEDDPGGPKDPVRLLRIRPCHLLGQVLASSLYPFAKHLHDTGQLSG